MRFPRWRFFTWVILAFNVLMLVWVIAGASAADCGTDVACEAGTAIGVGIVMTFWVIGDIILGILWLITNKKPRQCPVCGKDVKKGLTICKTCGHDFAAAAR